MSAILLHLSVDEALSLARLLEHGVDSTDDERLEDRWTLCELTSALLSQAATRASGGKPTPILTEAHRDVGTVLINHVGGFHHVTLPKVQR